MKQICMLVLALVAMLGGLGAEAQWAGGNYEKTQIRLIEDGSGFTSGGANNAKAYATGKLPQGFSTYRATYRRTFTYTGSPVPTHLTRKGEGSVMVDCSGNSAVGSSYFIFENTAAQGFSKQSAGRESYVKSSAPVEKSVTGNTVDFDIEVYAQAARSYLHNAEAETIVEIKP